MSEKHHFQAEIQQLLDIVIHSLYTDKEIFVRELVSNASDALEKLRHIQLTEKEIFDDKLAPEINLTTDDQAKTVTIQDFGIGMTRDELVKNLAKVPEDKRTAVRNNGASHNLVTLACHVATRLPRVWYFSSTG